MNERIKKELIEFCGLSGDEPTEENMIKIIRGAEVLQKEHVRVRRRWIEFKYTVRIYGMCLQFRDAEPPHEPIDEKSFPGSKEYVFDPSSIVEVKDHTVRIWIPV